MMKCLGDMAMKLRTMGRHGKEGLKNIGRNGWMTFASISSVTVALLLVGFFIALMLNLNHIANTIKGQVEVKAYVQQTATTAQMKELQKNIEALPLVKSVKFVSKKQGLNELINSMSHNGKKPPVLLSLRQENPLPNSFVIQPKKPENSAIIAKQVKSLNYVSDVRYGKQTVNKLFRVIHVARDIGIALIIGLLFTAVFLIGNTIKLTIVSRRREIEIMKLVGATNGFIRWPFFVEGLLLGIMGSAIPIGLLISGYSSFYNFFYRHYTMMMFVKLLPLNPEIYYLCVGLGLIGACIGVWGSVTSVRKFLKV